MEQLKPCMKNKLIELLRESSFNTADYCSKTDCEECNENYENGGGCFLSLESDYLISKGVTTGKDNNIPTKWIHVEERLPVPEQDVLVSCKYATQYQYQCEACYITPKWDAEESFFSWDSECLEYFEENDGYEKNDGYYVKSGWYERIHNSDEYFAVGIEDTVTHWMPLPRGPKDDYKREFR